MNDGDLLTVELGNLALAVVDLDAVVNAEHVDGTSLAEENFILGWVCSVCLVVHCQAINASVVLASKDKESWRLVILDVVRRGEAQSHNWVLGGTRTLGEPDLLTNFVSVWFDPAVFHWCTSEEHE